MISLLHLWLPILLSAVFVFLASSLIHMLFKWHNSDYRKLPNEDEVREAIRAGNPTPGQYGLPHCIDLEVMKGAEVQKKYTDGPVGLLYLKASGVPNMGSALVGWFFFSVVISFCVAYLTSRVLPGGTHYLQVFRVAGTVAFLAYAGNAAQASIWMGKPWRSTLKELLDGLIYGLVTAGTFGWLWPR
jgi:hypothetical protein